MRRGYWIALVGLLVCGLGSGNWGCNGDRSDKGPQTYYVAPTGNDQADGSAERPFATLARAVEASRQVAVAQPSRARRIVLRGGEYFGVSVALTGKDSGLSIEAAAGRRRCCMAGCR